MSATTSKGATGKAFPRPSWQRQLAPATPWNQNAPTPPACCPRHLAAGSPSCSAARHRVRCSRRRSRPVWWSQSLVTFAAGSADRPTPRPPSRVPLPGRRRHDAHSRSARPDQERVVHGARSRAPLAAITCRSTHPGVRLGTRAGAIARRAAAVCGAHPGERADCHGRPAGRAERLGARAVDRTPPTGRRLVAGSQFTGFRAGP